MTFEIHNPRGSLVMTEGGKAELKFNTDFAVKWSKRYTLAQKFIDFEVLRLSEPFIPLLTSMLIKSGIIGTDIGSGTVQWIAPYARAQYYRGRRPGTSDFGPLRGRYWFERMKQIYGKQIIKGSKQFAAGQK